MPWLLSPTNAIDNLKIGLYGESPSSQYVHGQISLGRTQIDMPQIGQEAELEHLPLADTKVVNPIHSERMPQVMPSQQHFEVREYHLRGVGPK
jgi:hypothetical protein